MKRIRLAILYGGRSGEHEISLRSARSILEAIDRDKYELVLIGIDPEGHWHLHSEASFRQLTASPLARVQPGADEVFLAPWPAASLLAKEGDRAASAAMAPVDVVFPVLHGTYGEDGTVQGLLELAGIPYVGAGVLGSAVGMDKDVQKRLLRDAGLPIVDYFATRQRDWDTEPAQVRAATRALGLPLFVKPANMGSSVGVTKVSSAPDLDAAIASALAYDDKIVIERGIAAREIECSVLGNDKPEASVPGEVYPQDEFYSYAAKYVNEDGAKFAVPAPLAPGLTELVQQLAVRAFRTIGCEGMARVDFFLERDTEKLFVNEVNTIPGFTSISQYPRLWAACGLSYPELIDRLIALACERHQRRQQRKTTYRPDE